MQALAPRMTPEDGEDSQGTIPYYKGQLFLEYLEGAYGREAFDAFLNGYFEAFGWQTITTEMFLAYLDQELLSVEGAPLARAQVEPWLYEAGLPDDAPLPVSATLDAAAAMASDWSAGAIATADVPFDVWSAQAVIHFINSLPEDLSHEKLADLDTAHAFSETRNAEIARTWFIQVATRRYTPAYPQLEAHLNRFGRGRLIAPVYRALASNGEDLDLAREMFERAKETYHPLVAKGIAQGLEDAPG